MKFKMPLFLKKFYKQLVNIPSTPEDIAFGAALGCLVGHMPIMGAQILFLLFLKMFFNFNIVSASMFTLVSNPFTAPFLYPFLLWVGTFFFPLPLKLVENISPDQIIKITEYWFSEFIHYFGEIIGYYPSPLPFPEGFHKEDLILFLKTGIVALWVGGLFIGLITSFFVYFLVLKGVSLYQEKKLRRGNPLNREPDSQIESKNLEGKILNEFPNHEELP